MRNSPKARSSYPHCRKLENVADTPNVRQQTLADITLRDRAIPSPGTGLTASRPEMDRRWLLGEVDRLTRERDKARHGYKALRRVIRDWAIRHEPS
jgi:hypothetical protein